MLLATAWQMEQITKNLQGIKFCIKEIFNAMFHRSSFEVWQSYENWISKSFQLLTMLQYYVARVLSMHTNLNI